MKLKYNGRLKTGMVKFPNGSTINVTRGNIYEVNDIFVASLLGSGWEKVENKEEVVDNKKKFNKKIKEEKIW